MVFENLQESVAFIRSQTQFKPRIGLVLGSGLGSFAKEIVADKIIPYDEIPHFVPPTVEGHTGRLILGELSGANLAVLQGRVHYYEGHTMEQVVYPIRLLSLLGVQILILTNAAGGLDASMKAGDLMIITDHINLMGDNPLKGPNLKELGTRFPDMTEAYDRELTEKLKQTMVADNIRHHLGVYCAVSGPTYETPSEVKFLQMIGGKAVGMSTVPENIVANHMGMRVCAISCITNLAAGISKTRLSHDEVTETAKNVEKEFKLCLTDFLKQL